MSGIITNLSQPVSSVEGSSNFFTVPAGKYAIATFTAYCQGVIANATKVSGSSSNTPVIYPTIFERAQGQVTVFFDENTSVSWELRQNVYDITVPYDIADPNINDDEQDRTLLAILADGVATAQIHIGGVKANYTTSGVFNGTDRFQLQMDYAISKNVAFFDK